MNIEINEETYKLLQEIAKDECKTPEELVVKLIEERDKKRHILELL